MKLHHQIIGEGPTLLLLGGLGDQARNWLSIASQLKNNFRIILPDHRDAGQSPRCNEAYSLSDITNDHVTLLDDLEENSVHVFGFSMGGKVALDLALRHPEKIKKLILCSTSPAWDKPFPAKDHVTSIMSQAQNSSEFFEKQYSILFGKSYQEKIPANAFVKFRLRDDPPFDAAGFHRQRQASQSFDCSESVSQIENQTLILHGTEDEIVPIENARWLNSHLKRNVLDIFENTGHALPAENPKRFVEAIKKFLTAQK